MAFEIWLFVVVVLIIFLILILMKGVKWAVGFLVNAALGYLALWATQAWLIPSLPVNFWSVLIVAIFGIVGYLIVLLLHLLGIWL